MRKTEMSNNGILKKEWQKTKEKEAITEEIKWGTNKDDAIK
jgi:hypothetical protein